MLTYMLIATLIFFTLLILVKLGNITGKIYNSDEVPALIFLILCISMGWAGTIPLGIGAAFIFLLCLLAKRIL